MPVLVENMQNTIAVTENLTSLTERAADECLKYEGFTLPAEISILLVDNERIKEMNSEFRNVDRATDVLSFPIVDMKNGKIQSNEGDFNLDDEVLVLGDIVISLEMAVEQAEKYGHSFERELAFLVTHGVFHLLGYDHENEDDGNIMFGKQEAVLAGIGLAR